jgi:hypothetical protein
MTKVKIISLILVIFCNTSGQNVSAVALSNKELITKTISAILDTQIYNLKVENLNAFIKGIEFKNKSSAENLHYYEWQESNRILSIGFSEDNPQKTVFKGISLRIENSTSNCFDYAVDQMKLNTKHGMDFTEEHGWKICSWIFKKPFSEVDIVCYKQGNIYKVFEIRMGIEELAEEERF